MFIYEGFFLAFVPLNQIGRRTVDSAGTGSDMQETGHRLDSNPKRPRLLKPRGAQPLTTRPSALQKTYFNSLKYNSAIKQDNILVQYKTKKKRSYV